MNNTGSVYGLILSGGKSSRMGYDKSLINYHGKPQREFLAKLLEPYCEKTFFSCKSVDGIPEHLNPLPDFYTLESPLNGILTAFHFNNLGAWLTVPVDMPLINAETIEFLLELRDKNKFATCFYDSTGDYPEPLLTIWEPQAGPELKSFYETGNFSPRKFLMSHDVNIISSPQLSVLTNINSTEELDLFRLSNPSSKTANQ